MQALVTIRAAGRGATLALLVGCGDDGILIQNPPPAPPPAAVTAIIDRDGGTIDGPGGVSLTIPAGALRTSTRITIAQDGTGAPGPPPGSAAVGPTFSLTPHGLTFGAPVTLKLPATATPQGAVLLKSNRGGDGWEQLDAVESNGTITAAITSFSWGARFCCFPAPQLGGPIDIAGVPEGGFWIFNVSAVGSAPFTYQWFRDGVPIFGETNRDILLNPVRITDDGALYSVLVTDRDGIAATSRAATLGVVALPPTIVSDPTDLQVTAGASATFSAASTSSIAQSLQWQRSNDAGQSWTTIAGATSGTYTLNNAHLTNDNDARFRMLAGNASPLGPQPTASRAARLTVTGIPVAPAIVSPPLAITVNEGTSASFSVGASGTSLDYQWERAASTGGPFAPIPNATSATYTISNTAMSDNLAAFRVRVSNTAGSVSSTAAALTVVRAPSLALVRVAGGGEHSVGLRGDGRLLTWGGNGDGQLGDGTTTSRSTPGTVAGPMASQCSVALFAVGWQHNLALCANGDVWSWGDDEFGALGLPGHGTDILLPQRSSGGPARHVAASRGTTRPARLPPGLIPGAHSLSALANNPLMASWGANDQGQLGDGLLAQARGPGLVPSLSNVVGVAAGAQFSLALRADGTVSSWGANGYGQLANGSFTANLRPTPIQSLRNIIAIAAGLQFAMAIDRNGVVFAWGDNQHGQVGDGTRTDRSAAVSVPLPRPAVAIAAGNFHSLALLDDGSVYGWGSNGYGAVGAGPSGGVNVSTTPQRVSAPLPAVIVTIGAGGSHSLAVDSNHDVWSWGRNHAGQLGDGTTQDRPSPGRVVNGSLR